MEWNRLKVFYYVAICQSLTKAAVKLNTNQPSLSKCIATLEYQLKTTLFLRTRKGLILTKQGERLFKTVKPMFCALKTIKSEFLEENKLPQGDLIISATHGIVNFFLSPFLPNFLKLYPDIKVQILAKDDLPSFDFGEADIALCPPTHDRKDLVQKHLLTNHVVLYASPEYLEKNGTPEKPEDLDTHQLISVGEFSPCFGNMNWHLGLGCSGTKKRSPYITITPPQCRLLMAEKGLGICAISKEHPGLNEMNLVPVLPHIPGPVVETFLIYPECLKDSKRIEAFEQYIIPLFQKAYGPLLN